ncbi:MULTISPECIES: restriction endonuclease subunit S [Listeria]|uniref:restriction endonuclease subunit S n=1 Tax=Listeria TaxID=1637 RepID=UPI001E5632AD|nr:MULTISPECIES: restriction endonuclease subunit S [Listeria]
MPKLDEVEWGEFEFSDTCLFKIQSTNSGIDKIKINRTGKSKHPFITRSEKNNGLNELIPVQNKPFNSLNTISIGLDTQTVFYQPTDYYTGQNIQVVESPNLNREIAFFLIPLIKSQVKVLSWGGNGATLSRLKAKRILLPILKDSTPDWGYMEQYIVNKIATKEVPNLDPIKASSIDLKSAKWHEFKINDIMDVLGGVRLTSSDMRYGNIPFIGASDSNNGITNWTSDINSSTDNNILGINYNGSVGEVFYHPYLATFSDDVKRLKLKFATQATKEVHLFIKTMLLQQKDKYAYGYKFNGTRMKAQKIKLPAFDESTPDWKFMEDYIKSISNSHLL